MAPRAEPAASLRVRREPPASAGSPRDRATPCSLIGTPPEGGHCPAAARNESSRQPSPTSSRACARSCGAPLPFDAAPLYAPASPSGPPTPSPRSCCRRCSRQYAAGAAVVIVNVTEVDQRDARGTRCAQDGYYLLCRFEEFAARVEDRPLYEEDFVMSHGAAGTRSARNRRSSDTRRGTSTCACRRPSTARGFMDDLSPSTAWRARSR